MSLSPLSRRHLLKELVSQLDCHGLKQWCHKGDSSPQQKMLLHSG